MPSQRLYGGLATLFLSVSCCRLSLAIAPAPLEPALPIPPAAAAPASSPSTIYFAPQNPATGLDQLGATPALRALPVSPADLGTDASTTRKFYTISTSLREVYDANVNTSNNNQQSSLETDLTPSVLVDFPTPDGDFSGRYSLSATYYTNGPDSSGNGTNANPSGNNKSSLQISHELNASLSHSFSNRFGINLAEDFRYSTEPGILQSTGTNYQNGDYISNELNGSGSAQWTPLFGSSATFSDTVVRYNNALVAKEQDSVENSASGSVNYAVLPKISASAGGVIDNITYQQADRGYTSFTGFGGGSWQALPNLSFTARAGASYTQTVQSQGSFAPYAALSGSWNVGARSVISLDYAHEVTPSSQVGANGQISDRISATVSYQITTRLSAHLNGIFTASTVTNGLQNTNSNSSVPNNYQESVYELDTGLNYQFNSFLSFDTGITLSGVDSDISNNNYTRDEVYVGVRGTY